LTAATVIACALKTLVLSQQNEVGKQGGIREESVAFAADCDFHMRCLGGLSV
jgi:hypothetical protein